MKIWAYADCHIGTSETLKELEITPDFGNCAKFINLVNKEQPDLVISVGDFSETILNSQHSLESAHGKLIATMRQVTDIFLQGNHDPDAGENMIQREGIQFLHGHQWERASEGFEERLHRKANAQQQFTVIAHSHKPEIGTNFMDVGSLTLSGTFGDLEGPLRRLRTVEQKEGVLV